MKALKKSTLASLVGAAALATAGAANATIVVGGENGYEFSVDGNINQFFIHADPDASGADSSSEVANGLLPTFFGFNVKAPEVNGLTVGARVSISPSTNGGSYTYPGGDVVQDGNAMEQREAFATVDGAFGQILMGKALGLYSSNNILLDQTLFGVGAVNPGGVTTLGRIGYGYDYANWRSQIKWTSNNMNGFQVAAAVMDADDVGVTGSSTSKDPRFEAQVSYGTDFDNGSMKLWLDGMTQKVDTVLGEVDSDAYTVGGQVLFSGFEVVGAYYDNEGVGDLGGLAFSTATDVTGEEREGDGYYAQVGYNFAGSTWLKTSYGESTLDRTSFEKSSGLGLGSIDERSMWTVGVYHDITSNLKLVAEYSQQEEEFHDGSDNETDVISLGGFISW